MVENTVERVLAAEKEAQEIIHSVEINARERKEEAAREREADHKEALREAREQGEVRREKARAEADRIRAEAQAEADKTGRVLSTMALARGDDVLKIILEEITK